MKLEEFLKIRVELKKQNKSLVFTNGCFDIIHRGHISYLNDSKKLCDFLVIGLNSDSSVKKLKGESRPVNNENDRMFILENIKPVDAVIIFVEDTPYNLIKAIMPDTLVKGGDWKPENIVGSDIVIENGGKVFSLKYVDNYSTTSTIEKMKKV